MSLPKIHVVHEYGDDFRPHSTTFIRLIRPLTHPRLTAHLNTSFDLRYQDQSADMVIVDRLWRPDVTLERVKVLVNNIRLAGAKFIYTLDDNFLDLVHENKGWPPIEFLEIVEYLLRRADGVVVSTSIFKNRLQNFNKNIIVIPNALDERLLVRRYPSEGYLTNSKKRISIGYMGTFTHDDDLMMVLPALEEVCKRHPDKIEIQLVGIIRRNEIKNDLQNIPIRYLSPSSYENEYPLFMLWFTGRMNWDIAISPLRDTPFNRSKSDIKFLDYCAIGAAGVFSQVPPYESTVQHMKTGWLAENQTEAWVEALDKLITDDDLRIYMARNATRYLFKKRVLSQCAPKWLEVVSNSLGLDVNS